MAFVQFEVSEKYNIPSILSDLSVETNESILDAIATVLTHGNSINTDSLQRNLNIQMKKETDHEVNRLRSELAEKIAEMSQIEQKNTTSTTNMSKQLADAHEKHTAEIAKINEVAKEYQREADKLRADIEQQTNNSIAIALLKQQLAENELIKKHTAEITRINEQKTIDNIEHQARITEHILQIDKFKSDLAADALKQQLTLQEIHTAEIAKINEQLQEYQRDVYKLQAEIEYKKNDNLLKQQLAENELIKKYTAEITQINEQKTVYAIKLQLMTDEYKQQIDTLRVELEESRNIEIDKLNGQLQEYKDTIDKLTLDLATAALKSELTSQKTHSAEIAKINKLLEQKNNEINTLHIKYTNDMQRLSESETNRRLEEMNNQLTPMYKFYNGSNNDKGTLGEFTVKKILEDVRFSGALVQNVSGTAEDSDIYFCFSNLKCLIEVKNKIIITRDDVAKFERDAAKNLDTNKINCALFVSLASNKLVDINISYIYTKMLNGIPLVHIHLTSPNELFLAIAYLQSAVDLQTDVLDEDVNKLKVHFNNYYSFAEETLIHLTKQRKIFTSLLKEIDDRIRLVQGNQDKIAVDAHRYMIDNETIVSNENRTPEYYAKILATYALDAKTATISGEEQLKTLLGVSDTTIFPSIIKLASTLIIKHCVPQESVNLINAAYAEADYPADISNHWKTYKFRQTTDRNHKKLRYKGSSVYLPPIDEIIIAYVRSFLPQASDDEDELVATAVKKKLAGKK